MRLARRHAHHAKRKAGLSGGGGQAIFNRHANSARLNSNQKGSGSGLFLSILMANQRQPGMGNQGEGHVAIPRMPMANFIVTQSRRAFGFFQEVFDMVARAANLSQDVERGG